MAEKAFNLTFDGYWRDEKKSSIPAESGVYCVYRCTYDKGAKTVSLKELIYIGEADDVCDRIGKHERYEDWKFHLNAGEQLCFSFAPVVAGVRVRCEAAMIFRHKPPENTEYRDEFPFDKTAISLSGKIGLLADKFTVAKT